MFSPSFWTDFRARPAAWRLAAAGLIGSVLAIPAARAADLPELAIDLKQTTVSGISSGAFMAVQMGVAKSASVRGVAATAGGPYLCALDGAYSPTGVLSSIARCMQGDPDFKAFARPGAMGPAELDDMARRAKSNARWKKIDPVEHLQRQALWVFRGSNDGIVKQPVAQGLVDWYRRFAPASQLFYKDNLNAAHAQISAACPAAPADAPASAAPAACNLCPTTGGSFINTCPDRPAAADHAPYDAAGSALQMFYGPLTRTPSARLSSQPQAFDQRPYLRLFDGTRRPKASAELAMGETGYVYVPPACRDGQACRLHIAFHGCMQSATTIGRSFVDTAGLNEWADANRLVVLYPQAMPTNAEAAAAGDANPWALASYKADEPLNPMGCWDWWGYNDNVAPRRQPGGSYATAQGLQIAAVWRMAQKLAAKGQPGSLGSGASSAGATPQLRALDQSATQVLLRWQPVVGATGYRVYRTRTDLAAAAPQAAGPVTTQPFWADAALSPATAYRYTVRAVVGGKEGADSNGVSVSTSPAPAACDPYFSLSKNRPVDRNGQPTDAVCE